MPAPVRRMNQLHGRLARVFGGAQVYQASRELDRRVYPGLDPERLAWEQTRAKRDIEVVQLLKEDVKGVAAQKQFVISTIVGNAAEHRKAGGLDFSGVTLRLCILGLTIFLVQILVQLYRYNSRLIAFYSSRRDAILMSGGEA